MKRHKSLSQPFIMDSFSLTAGDYLRDFYRINRQSKFLEWQSLLGRYVDSILFGPPWKCWWWKPRIGYTAHLFLFLGFEPWDGKVLRVLLSGLWLPRNQGWLNFRETRLVTVRKSLHRSCWTELTCQEIARHTLDICPLTSRYLSNKENVMESPHHAAPVGTSKIFGLVQH